MRALIVEDEFMNRTVLQEYMSEYGETDIAVNGKEAVEVFKNSLTANKPFDIIFLDIMMPEMDGHSALIEIRKIETSLGKTEKEFVKVVMTSALSDADNITKSFRESCESYLIKPLRKEKITNLLKRFKLI